MIEITIDNLAKRFGKVHALAGVSLKIAPGEFFFLLGPSGCGKTTLLRLLAGFLEPDGGAIRFGERRIDNVPAHKRNTGMVFQNYALWPHMSVFRNVAYGLDVRRVPAEEKARRVSEILGLVRMSGYEERLPGELSGGQQQRVALARALVIDPDVVLLDEPLSNLDAKLRSDMRAEIRRIHDRTGRTFVYVTHDQKEALSMADRIAVMNEGRIEQVGAPEEVYTSPANLFVAKFLGGANVVSGRVKSCSDGLAFVETPAGTLAARIGSRLLVAGDAAVIALRPELIHAAATGEANAVDAELSERMYLGEIIQYQLLASGVELTATAPSAAPLGAHPGERVRIAFDARAAAAFPAE